ncbi:MAG TPA: GNAT family N-acetyltransferase [Microbacterium sp.]|uniref:GNAT family N-acetyltransferase n=1 Tax=Microbacterium sp. TaxID=51671 RepID=UPI002C64E64E|nr:GNAT family N-acetyltransferase [Microbacterium sp.]HWI31411.1 GNAT family N-acetyltransferase [Microbacterium sp.]
MTEVTVRRASVDDAAGIGRVQVQGWHEAYTGRMPQAILDRLDVGRSTNAWRRVLAGVVAGDESDIWVAERAHTIVGFASSGACRDEDATPGRRELFAMYVLAEHYGTGVGQALVDAAIGDAAASLWMLEDNPRARAFYRRNGFEPDGHVKDDDRWGEPVREVRLIRRGGAGESPDALDPVPRGT